MQIIMDLNPDLFQRFINVFDKKNFNTNKQIGINSENKELVKELHKPIIRKFENIHVLPIIFGAMISHICN